MNRAYGDARNVAAQPSSCRCPTRIAGWHTSLSVVRSRLPRMSAVMSSCGNRPGTSPLTWMPYGPHSTASVSVRSLTLAFAAAECAKPGPPVHAYDAPTLMIEPGVPASRCRRANSRAHRNVPFNVMSTTVRHAFGDMSSAGTGKLAAALLTSTPGNPNCCSAASNIAVMSSGSRMSQRVTSTGAPSASIAARPASRCSSFRLATTIDAPSRANSDAIALPRPVPAPVTSTQTPSNVPSGNAVAPTGGGSGRPLGSVISRPSSWRSSAPREARLALRRASSAQLCHVVAPVDERLVDHLVGHRGPDLGHRQVSYHLACHLHGDDGRLRDLLRDLADGGVELALRHQTAHDAVVERLLRRQHAPGQHEIADHAVPARLVQDRDAAGVRDHAVRHLRQPEPGALGGDPDVAEQRALERPAHDPALARDDHDRVELPQLLDRTVPPAHQLVVRELGPGVPDRRDVATRRERLALTTPDHRADLGPLLQRSQDVEELRVHVIVERVVLVGVVVRDGRDRPVDVESDPAGHLVVLSAPLLVLRSGGVPVNYARRPRSSSRPGRERWCSASGCSTMPRGMKTRLRAWVAALAVAAVVVATADRVSAGVTDGGYPRGDVIVTDAEPEVDDVSHVAAGPNDTIWFTCLDGDRIGRVSASGDVTTFRDPAHRVHYPLGITTGSDGNVWFVSFDNDRIGRITPAGQITTFPVHGHHVSLLGGIASGPDGNLWFTMRDAVGRITPTGGTTVFTRPGLDIDVSDAIAAGPDGNVWFTSYAWRDRHHGARNQIGRVTPTGRITMFSDRAGEVRYPGGITAGADGNVWFTSRDNNRIGRITPSGSITTFRVPPDDLRWLEAITAGPDGNLWFTGTASSQIGRITPAGKISAFSQLSVELSNDSGIAAGADGNLWFAEYYRISRVTPSGVFTRFPR